MAVLMPTTSRVEALERTLEPLTLLEDVNEYQRTGCNTFDYRPTTRRAVWCLHANLHNCYPPAALSGTCLSHTISQALASEKLSCHASFRSIAACTSLEKHPRSSRSLWGRAPCEGCSNTAHSSTSDTIRNLTAARMDLRERTGSRCIARPLRASRNRQPRIRDTIAQRY